MQNWIYDEYKQVGVDYAGQEASAAYDGQMEAFRDYRAETAELVGKLQLADPGTLTAIDLGCGTGAFAVHAAEHFKKILAVDVSEAMLGIARAKAEAAAIPNIEFHHSGFLHFRPAEQADVICSKWALHHLPDYWKQAALRNINAMLRPGGTFFLCDVVFQFAPDYREPVEALLDELTRNHSRYHVEETKIHIREEYSTFDWILQGMLERAGFDIVRTDTENMLQSEYLCRKVRG
jgi:ubiquinone/menaquinone biosynthesis C-methylase UbiE